MFKKHFIFGKDFNNEKYLKSEYYEVRGEFKISQQIRDLLESEGYYEDLFNPKKDTYIQFSIIPRSKKIKEVSFNINHRDYYRKEVLKLTLPSDGDEVYIFLSKNDKENSYELYEGETKHNGRKLFKKTRGNKFLYKLHVNTYKKGWLLLFFPIILGLGEGLEIHRGITLSIFVLGGIISFINEFYIR